MPKQPPRQPQSRHPALRYTSQGRSPTPFALSLSKPVLRLSKGAHHHQQPPQHPTPPPSHPDTSPFPPTPPNPYPTPMNTAPHTATTTTKAPANTHARSAQSTPPLNPNRPPGIVSPEKEQSRNATQVGQGNSTTPPLAPGGTLTRPYCPHTGASATVSPWQSQSPTATRTSRVPMQSGAPALSLAAWSASMVRGAPSSNMRGCCPSAKKFLEL